jgi:thiamine biosynthesis lipoprotein
MKKSVLIGGMMISAACLFALTSCKPKTNSEPYKATQFNVGTYVDLSIYDDGKKDQVKESEKIVNDTEKKIEVNEEGISELDQVNAKAGVEPVKVSKVVFDFVSDMTKYAKETKGMYNPAIGSIMQLWHIGFPDAKLPTDAEIKALLGTVNYKDIVLDKDKSTIFLKKKNMQIDPGGMGKGLITQEILNYWKKEKVTTGIINLGGHVYVLGDNPNSDNGDWKMAIDDPSRTNTEANASGTANPAAAKPVAYVSGKNISVITTSEYGRYLVVDGKTYSHLIDSETGKPYDNNLLSVTIIGEDPIKDDAYSNSLYNLGLKDGLKEANKHKDMKVAFITKDKKVYLSDNLKDDKSFELTKGSGFELAK